MTKTQFPLPSPGHIHVLRYFIDSVGAGAKKQPGKAATDSATERKRLLDAKDDEGMEG